MKKSAVVTPALDARVDHFGRRLVAELNRSGAELPRDISERLRFAREHAVARAQAARASRVESVRASGMVAVGQTLALGGGNEDRSGLSKWISLLPLTLLIAGLLLVHRGQLHEQIRATAEVDTALLSDHLPPAAYSDPGFAEFLRTEKE